MMTTRAAGDIDRMCSALLVALLASAAGCGASGTPDNSSGQGGQAGVTTGTGGSANADAAGAGGSSGASGSQIFDAEADHDGSAGGPAGPDRSGRDGGGSDGSSTDGVGPDGAADGSGADQQSSVTYLGCTYAGAIDRLVVSKRDAARDLCFNLVLDFPGQAPAGLSLPAGFGLGLAGVTPSSICPSRGFASALASQVTGTVDGAGSTTGVAGHPAQLRVDVTFTFTASDAGAPASERLIADSVDVQSTCPVPVCTPGADQTCNDDPAISSLHGHCTGAATCVCGAGFAMNPVTGRCR